MESIEPQTRWTTEELEQLDKKDILQCLQDYGSNDFLQKHKLKGQLASIAKKTAKPKILAAYDEIWETKNWKSDDEKVADAVPKTQATTLEKQEGAQPEKAPRAQEVKTFTKVVLKKGKGTTFPNKGDSVTVRFRGSLLSNGTVFQDNTSKKEHALTFKVGVGQVVKGLDDAIVTMSEGEKSKITIPAEFAYGKKGKPPTIPPNETLIFEVDVEKVF